MKTKYLTVEGGDGSGKTTLVKNLHAWLLTKKKEILLTKEFGSELDKFCVKVRELALSSEYKVDELAGQMAFASIIRQHHQKVLKPALDSKKYDLILSDRGVDSNYAYGPAHGLENKVIKNLFKLAYADGLTPDITIYLNIDPLLAAYRRTKRAKEKFGADGTDRVEDKGITLQNKVRRNFLKIADAEPDRVKVIEITNEKTPEMVLEEVLKILRQQKII